jgi:hypothetical protein
MGRAKEGLSIRATRQASRVVGLPTRSVLGRVGSKGRAEQDGSTLSNSPKRKLTGQGVREDPIKVELKLAVSDGSRIHRNTRCGGVALKWGHESTKLSRLPALQFAERAVRVGYRIPEPRRVCLTPVRLLPSSFLSHPAVGRPEPIPSKGTAAVSFNDITRQRTVQSPLRARRWTLTCSHRRLCCEAQRMMMATNHHGGELSNRVHPEALRPEFERGCGVL